MTVTKELVIVNLRPFSHQNSLNEFAIKRHIKIINNPLFQEQLNETKIEWEPYLKWVHYIVITSKYALDYLVRYKDIFNLPIIVIGNKLYHEALKYFSNVIYAGKDSEELILYLNDIDNILYIRGEEVSNDLKSKFSHKYFEEYIGYKMIKTNNFDDKIIQYVNKGNKLVVPIFSLNTAKEFCYQLHKRGLNLKEDLVIIAFSIKIAQYFENKFNRIITASKPEMEEVIKILTEIWEEFNEAYSNSSYSNPVNSIAGN